MHTAAILYNGELRTTATHPRSGSVIETDAPVDNNGKGERFSPTDMVASALGSCMLTIMGIKARDKGWNIDGTTVSIDKIMGTDPRRITGVKVLIAVPQTAGLDDTARKILENAALTCPVAKSLHPDIQQDVTFTW
ncbi:MULTISPECIES: OsmC family protein [Chitinophaga]|uniref:OsmC family protein n=1 Tax=Chitinophaga caseinilytica TaxID=2267521 RepID=A0ABZ2ZBT1_9BACT|nr:OsmC family protein [Chitinophaga rhizosphaerae]